MRWLVPYGIHPAVFFIALIIAIGLYIYIYWRNPKLAWVILGLMIVGVVYYAADWNYWRDAFHVQWSLDRYQ